MRSAATYAYSSSSAVVVFFLPPFFVVFLVVVLVVIAAKVAKHKLAFSPNGNKTSRTLN